jgi:hypothetical protein
VTLITATLWYTHSMSTEFQPKPTSTGAESAELPIITKEDIYFVLEAIRESQADTDASLTYLIMLFWDHPEELDRVKDMVGVIGILSRDSPDIEQAIMLVSGRLEQPKIDLAVEWGLSFLEGMLKDLRDVICGAKRLPGNLKWPKGTFGPIFAGILATFGVTNPIALTLLTFVAMLLAHLGKKRFCEMTEEGFLQALRHQIQQSA